MKIKRASKGLGLIILSAILAGGMVCASVSAQESDKNIKVSGITETLRCTEAAKNMKKEYPAKDEENLSWSERVGLKDFAADFYYAMVEGADGNGEQDILIEDKAFSEDEAVAVAYSDGTETLFNGIELVNIVRNTKFVKEEWSSICEELCYAYNAFLWDYPEVSWLRKNPQIIRVCSERGDAGNKEYEYKVYLVLKNHNTGYDLRKKAYKNEKAIRTEIAGQDQSMSVSMFADSEAQESKAQESRDQKQAQVYNYSSAGQHTAIDAAFSFVFKNYYSETIYYGDTWGKYVDLTDIKPGVYVCPEGIAVPGIPAADGEFILKNYRDGSEIFPDDPINIQTGQENPNPHMLYWRYSGEEYSLAGASSMVFTNVKPKEITVSEGTLKVTKADNGDYVINGEPEFSGLVFGETIKETERTVDVTDSVNPADRTIKVKVSLTTENGVRRRYSLTDGELWIPLDAQMEATPEITIGEGPYIYNGTEHCPPVTVKIDGTVLGEEEYEVSYLDNINAGTAVVTVTAKEGGFYTWLPAEETFEISKAEWPEDRRKGEGFTRYGKEAAFNLSELKLLAEGAEPDITNVTATNTEIFAEEPTVSNHILQYMIENSEEYVQERSTVTIPVGESENYLPYSITFTITVTESSRQDFKFVHEIQKKPVGNTDKLETAGAAEGSTITYQSMNEDIATIGSNGKIHALKEGRVTIRATASAIDEYEEAEAECTIIVVPKENTVELLEQETGGEQYKVEIETGISQISKAFKEDTELGLDTADKIMDRMKEKVLEINPEIKEENIAVYDVTLMVWRNKSWVWEAVQDEEFPKDGLRIKIPYPKETEGKAYKFTVVHMFDDEVYGNMPGEIENPSVKKLGDTLQFTVHALSPIAVGWQEIQNDDPSETPPDDPAETPGNGSSNNEAPGDANQGTTASGNQTGGTGADGGNQSGGASTGSGSGTSAGAVQKLTSVLTGDTGWVFAYMMLFTDSLAVIAVVCLLRKRRKEK